MSLGVDEADVGTRIPLNLVVRVLFIELRYFVVVQPNLVPASLEFVSVLELLDAPEGSVEERHKN